MRLMGFKEGDMSGSLSSSPRCLTVRHRILFFVALLAALAPAARAGFVRASFEEVAQTADLVFVGTVAGMDCVQEGTAGMIFTQVSFSGIQVIRASDRSVQGRLGSVRLTYAGGKIGDHGVWVSVAPAFHNGHRYLVFMLDDGLVYANPVIGGPQGQFEVVQDKATLQDYVLTPDGRAVLEIGPDGIRTTTRPVDAIQAGAIFYRAETPAQEAMIFPQLPLSSGNDSVSAALLEARSASLETPLPLAAFVDYTLNKAMTAPLTDRILKFGNGGGKFITRVGDQIVEQDLAAMPSKRPGPSAADAASRGIAQSASIQEWYDADLFACGYHPPTFTMEQVAAGRWDYPLNGDAMAIWNFTIDLFRYSPDDGDFGGGNGENEFDGFIDDATYYSVYGFHWGTSCSMTVNYIHTDPCEEIGESDVMFNSAFNWTDDYLGRYSGGPLYYQDSVLHETGHSWGLMSGHLKSELYAYNHPSVMNGQGIEIMENAQQIHVADANLMRRIYDSLTSVPQVKDVGVESYYASAGLHKSTTNTTNYYPGDNLTIQNVTVENMSPTAQTDVRLRFYLSTDRTITTSDSQMGFYFGWASFTKESYNVANYTTAVPYIPSGQYYVGAIVTENGFGADGAPANNATVLPDPITVFPMPPSNVQASDGTYTNKIRVTWDAVTDPAVTGYRVWWCDTATGTKGYLGQTALNYYDDNDPWPGWNYYWIQSVAAIGISLYSSSDSGCVGVSAPAGLSASDGTYTTHVALSWTGVTGASGYEIWRNTQIDTATASQIGTSATNSYNDTTAVPELMYYYWVKATNSYTTSGFSAGDAGWRHLAMPTNIQASDGTFSDKVRVTWDIVAYASTYQVRRNTTNDFSTAGTVAPAASGTTYDDFTATPMQTYYYWVRAENGFGYSQFSPPESGYRSTPVPQAAEVVGDFGVYGLWMLHNNVWSQLSGLSPKAFSFADTDGDGTRELIGNFGIYGLWLWNSDVWSCLTLANPDSVISADIDADGRAEVVGDFGGIGLWVWNGGDWKQLTGSDPGTIAAADGDGDGDTDVIADFASGLWVYSNYTWTCIAPSQSESLTGADIDGDGRDEIVGDFGAAGVWFYDSPNWTCITDLNPEALLVLDHDGDGVDEIVGDFGIQWAHPEFSGLWLWDGGVLTHLNWNNAVTLIGANVDGHPDVEIVGTYLDVFVNALGLWICDEASWGQINPLSPEALAAGDVDADGVDEIITDFGTLGVWLWDAGAWTLLTGVNVDTIGAAHIK
jgi:hypothetical protein